MDEHRFRTARLMPYINKAIKSHQDLLAVTSIYRALKSLDPERFTSVREFREHIIQQANNQPQETV